MKTQSFSQAQCHAASGAFDFLLCEEKELFTTTEVGNAIGLNAETVRNLIEEGRLDAFRFSTTGNRKTNRVTRRSVLLYLTETADHDPTEFHRRMNALLAFLTRDQLAATATEVAKLIQKP